jgi:hypothetical protein
MANIDVLVAANFWWNQRSKKGAHHFILRVMPLLFQSLQSLYIETRKLPLHSLSGITPTKVGQQYSFRYGIFLNPNEYATLRSVLSLMADIYSLLNPLASLKNEELMELAPHIRKLSVSADQFRKVRNFYTHINEILTTKMDEHGITGARNTNCGIEYTSNAKACVHLVWHNNMIYFTYKGEPHEIAIEKAVFDPIFCTAKQIYSELVSHSPQNYTPVDRLFGA